MEKEFRRAIQLTDGGRPGALGFSTDAAGPRTTLGSARLAVSSPEPRGEEIARESNRNKVRHTYASNKRNQKNAINAVMATGLSGPRANQKAVKRTAAAHEPPIQRLFDSALQMTKRSQLE
jgi:hypothetical protein